MQGRELLLFQADHLTWPLTWVKFSFPIVRIDKVHSACVREGRTRVSIQCFLYPVKRSYCALCVQDSGELSAYVYDMFLASLSTHFPSSLTLVITVMPAWERRVSCFATHSQWMPSNGVPQDYCNNGTFLGSLWRPNKMPLQNLVFFWEIPLSGLLVFHHDGSKGIALKQTRQRINSAQGCLSFVYMEFLKHAKTSSLLCYLKNNQPFSNYQIKWKSGYL